MSSNKVNLKGNLDLEILKMVMPSLIGFFSLILFEIIDIFWVGKLGCSAIAAVGSASFIEWIIFSLMMITTVGCSTLVAQKLGESKWEEAKDVIRESFWLSLFLSFLFMAVMLLIYRKVLTFMGLDGLTLPLAEDYLLVLIYALPILYTLNLQGNIFNSYGDTKINTLLMVVALILNCILDPILIFGHFGFPELGVMGASIASAISQFVGVVLRGYYLSKRNIIPPFKTFLLFSKRYFKKIISIGFPTAMTNVVWTIIFPFLTIIISRFGMKPLAGMNLANRLEGFPYYFSISFSIAVSTLVAQSYGAGLKDQVKTIIKKAVIILTAILIPISLVFIFIPELIVRLLSSDLEVISHASDYLRIVGYFELFLGWEIIYEGAFSGLGNTRPDMYIRIPLTLIRVPLAYFLAIVLNLGVVGVWWAISLTTLAKGVTSGLVFYLNRQNKRLLNVLS